MSLVLQQPGKSAEEILNDRKERNKEAQKRFRDRRKKLQQRIVLSESATQHEQHHRLELSPPAHILIESLTSSNSLYTLQGNDLYSTAIAATSLTTYTSRGQISILPPRHGYTYAMLRNARLMGISADELFDSCKESRMIVESGNVQMKLSCDVMVKQMIDRQVESGNNTLSSEVPENMRPTPLQLATLHHSSIDTGIVWPSVRDKVMALLTANLLDTNKLIRDILTYDEIGGEEAAFHVYGDKTWDPQSWEVGERFAREWDFLFDKKIIHTTNDWRRRRGLDNLVLDVGIVSNRA